MTTGGGKHSTIISIQKIRKKRKWREEDKKESHSFKRKLKIFFPFKKFRTRAPFNLTKEDYEKNLLEVVENQEKSKEKKVAKARKPPFHGIQKRKEKKSNKKLLMKEHSQFKWFFKSPDKEDQE